MYRKIFWSSILLSVLVVFALMGQNTGQPGGGAGSGCATTGSGIQKGNGSGGCAAATASDVNTLLSTSSLAVTNGTGVQAVFSATTGNKTEVDLNTPTSTNAVLSWQEAGSDKFKFYKDTLNLFHLEDTSHGFDTFKTDANGYINFRTVANAPATITPSATPVIALTSGSLQTITLSANATPTVSGISAGVHLSIQICQPGAGGPYTWTWPAAIHGGMTIGTNASQCSQQAFNSFTGSTLVPESIGIANVSP